MVKFILTTAGGILLVVAVGIFLCGENSSHSLSELESEINGTGILIPTQSVLESQHRFGGDFGYEGEYIFRLAESSNSSCQNLGLTDDVRLIPREVFESKGFIRTFGEGGRVRCYAVRKNAHGGLVIAYANAKTIKILVSSNS